jgi:hypothetical protein
MAVVRPICPRAPQPYVHRLPPKSYGVRPLPHAQQRGQEQHLCARPLRKPQRSRAGSPINVGREHKNLGRVDLKIDDAPDLNNAEGATSQNTDVVGYIVIRW